MQDRMGKHEHQARDKLRNKIRCHMGKRDVKFPFSKLFRDLHILTLLQLQDLPADQPRQGCPVGKRDSADNTPESTPAGKGDQDQKQHMGNSHDDIDKQPHRTVHELSEDRRAESQYKGHHRADCRRQKSDPDTQRKSRNCPHEHVTSHPVRSKRILYTRCQIFSRKIRPDGSFLPETSEHRNDR